MMSLLCAMATAGDESGENRDGRATEARRNRWATEEYWPLAMVVMVGSELIQRIITLGSTHKTKGKKRWKRKGDGTARDFGNQGGGGGRTSGHAEKERGEKGYVRVFRDQQTS